jgi:methyltransferase (TIGR00027 family)
MESGTPSRTAIGAARHRAAHQILEQGFIFFDPLALRILGEDDESVSRWASERPWGRKMRVFLAVRSRFAEDAVATSVARGVRQLVVLGAGLDTFAYRCPFENLHIFEVDHPDTQAWKRQRLATGAIPVPDVLTFVPVDFERQGLAEGLGSFGFDPGLPAFFTWLGVVPYLTEEAIWSTLRMIAGLPNGGHVVFDYSNPPDSFPPELRARHETRAARVAELGEAFVSYFETDALHARLAALNFREIEDLGPREIVSRHFPNAPVPASDTGGHIIRASAGTLL